jgi:Mg-chelatase subunit ChlD
MALAQSGLDLPMEPPRFGSETAKEIIEPDPNDDDDGEDPRDTPPPVFYGEEIDTETDTIFYVIDRSCSMSWDLQAFVDPDGNLSLNNRMERAKAELIRSIVGLSDNFRFNVIAYSCGTASFAESLVEATEPTKKAAVAWVISLLPGGATGTGPATSIALSVKENRAVVLLTDGAPNCGASSVEGHREMIRRNNTNGSVINVFGISASGSYRSFCQGVAADSGGNYIDIP